MHRAPLCLPLLAAVSLCLPELSVAASNVTSEAGRRANLIEYVNSRTDLATPERQRWVAAIRQAFGGKALNDGRDEGVTGAKSVVSAAIFNDVAPEKGARAALAAYHDIARFVPPPIAVEYQMLAFSGRTPPASPRQMAFDFPRYFNEDIAPELVRWWTRMLDAERIPATERRAVTSALQETRKKMKPMLRDRLWQAVQLEAQNKATRSSNAETERLLSDINEELLRDFVGVEDKEASQDEVRTLYERYRSVCADLGEKPKENPKVDTKPRPAKSRVASPNDVEPQKQADDAPPASTFVPVPVAWPKPLNAAVERWLGTPYRYGGTDKNGIDCSGFTRAVMNESLRLALPRSSGAQYTLGAAVPRTALRPGDLVFFDTLDRGRVTHVTVFVGDGQIAHASSSRGVSRADLSLPYYQHAYVGARRVLRQ